MKTINFVAYRLGIDTDDLNQSFQDEYDEVLSNVSVEYQLNLEEDLVKGVEIVDDILEECACWLNWMCICESHDITNYLNSKEDEDE